MSNLDSSQYALFLGRVDGKAYFDTHADGTAGTRLAAHLDAIRGQYVTPVTDYQVVNGLGSFGSNGFFLGKLLPGHNFGAETLEDLIVLD